MKKHLLFFLTILIGGLGWSQISVHSFNDNLIGLDYVEGDKYSWEFNSESLVTLKNNPTGTFTALNGALRGELNFQLNKNRDIYSLFVTSKATVPSSSSPFPHGTIVKFNIPQGLLSNADGDIWPTSPLQLTHTAVDSYDPYITIALPTFINVENYPYYLISFHEKVTKNSGKITFVNEKDPSRTVVVDVNSPDVELRNNTDVNPSSYLLIHNVDLISDLTDAPINGIWHGDDYHVEIEEGTFKDLAGNRSHEKITNTFEVHHNILQDIELSSSTIQENALGGTLVGNITCNFNNEDDQSYRLITGGSYPDNSSFYISGNAVYTRFPLDFETKNRYQLGIIGTYTVSGYEVEKELTITVIDQDPEIPLIVAYYPYNTALAPTYSYSYTLPTSIKLKFNQEITKGSTGTIEIYKRTGRATQELIETIYVEKLRNVNSDITVAADGISLIAGLDVELEYNSTYYVVVDAGVVENHGGIELQDYVFVTGQGLLNPKEPNEVALYSLLLSKENVDENLGSFTEVGTFSFTSNQFTGPYDYFFEETQTKNDPEGNFFIQRDFLDANKYYLRLSKALDFELKSEYLIDVTIEDVNENRFTRTFTITVNDTDAEPPTDLLLDQEFFVDTAEVGTLVGEVEIVDPNGPSGFTYSLAGISTTDNSYFTIVGNQILVNAELEDAQTKNEYIIAVVATDPAGFTLVKYFEVLVFGAFKSNSNVAGAIQTITINGPTDLPYTPGMVLYIDAETNFGSPISYNLLEGDGFVFGDSVYVNGESAFKIEASVPASMLLAERTVTFEFVVSAVTSTSELVSTSVYPNPTTGMVYFGEYANYQVASIEGVVVASGEGSSVDLSALQSGVYFLSLNGRSIQLIKEQ